MHCVDILRPMPCILFGLSIMVKVLVVLCFTLLGAGVRLWLWPERSRLIGRFRALRGKTVPRFPLVLAHGLFGFDTFSLGNQRHAYFRGVAEHLRARGVEVYVLRVNPSASIADRAAQLAEQVRKISAPRVNIIGHSMGGLDARYAVAKLGLQDRVAALITIGTPHHGTLLADRGVRWLGDRLGLRALARFAGVDIAAFDNLTTAHLTTFNAEVLNHKRVLYASVVGRATPALLHPVLRVPGFILSQWSGDNDGLVPVSSQAWGKVLLHVDACHLAQIGWQPGFDSMAIFDPIIHELVHAGC